MWNAYVKTVVSIMITIRTNPDVYKVSLPTSVVSASSDK